MMCGWMSCSFCNKEMVQLFIPEKQHYDASKLYHKYNDKLMLLWYSVDNKEIGVEFRNGFDADFLRSLVLFIHFRTNEWSE